MLTDFYELWPERFSNKTNGVTPDMYTWTRTSILNTARSGKFSFDRAISQYCDEIWDVGTMPVNY